MLFRPKHFGSVFYLMSNINPSYGISRFRVNSFLLNSCLKYGFSRHQKASQLILHSPQELQRLFQQSSKSSSQKQKPWSTFKQSTQKFKVSLIGLPNCGKSSLFNCLIGQRLAIVDKQYGMTRDRREFTILDGLVTVVDTPGIQVALLTKNQYIKSDEDKEFSRKQLKKDVFQQTLNAIQQSDMILFVIDSKKPNLSEEEIILAKYLNSFNNTKQKNETQETFRKKCQIVVVCNKCDGVGWDQNYLINEIYSKLHLSNNNEQKKIFNCSAEEGTGVFEILEYINERVPYEMREQLEMKRKQRRERFQKLVKKMKQEIKEINRKADEADAKSKEKDDKKSDRKETENAASSGNQQENPINQPARSSAVKKIRIKDWQQDFRNLNPNPEQNQQLDYEDYEDHFIRPEQAFSANRRGVDVKNLRMKHSIKICFIGKPNVGKSSLINELLEQDKLLVSDIPHTTRDSLTTKLLYKGRKIELIDTAGLNTPNIQENQEEFIRKSQISTMLHVQQSHVVVYVMDAFGAFKVDDFKLINRVIQEGRPIVIVVNKWQAIKEQFRNKAKNYLLSQIDKNLGQLHGHPIVFVSAKMVLNIDQMMDKIVTTYDKWNKRISTGLLNNWLEKFKKLENLPKDSEQTLRINYVIQARTRPPHFIIFVNKKQIFKPNYMRFLMRNLAQEFELDGIPLRHTLRSTNNKQNDRWKKKKEKRDKKPSKTHEKMQELKKKYGDFTI